MNEEKPICTWPVTIHVGPHGKTLRSWPCLETVFDDKDKMLDWQGKPLKEKDHA